MASEDQPKTEQPEIEQVEQKNRMTDMSKIDFSKVSAIGRFYANHASANTTLFDVRLTLSCVHGDDATGGVVAEETVNIIMCPEMAAVVAMLLNKALNNYGKAYGGLRLPIATKQSPEVTPQKE